MIPFRGAATIVIREKVLRSLPGSASEITMTGCQPGGLPTQAITENGDTPEIIVKFLRKYREVTEIRGARSSFALFSPHSAGRYLDKTSL